MSWFRKEKPRIPDYPADRFEPVIRCSICTGEQVACVRERTTGKLHELMLLRDTEDLETFCARYGFRAEEIRRIY